MSDRDAPASLTRTCAPHEVHFLFCSPNAGDVTPASSGDVAELPAPKKPISAPLTSFHSLADTHRSRHAIRHASPPRQLGRPLPPTQPSFSGGAKRMDSANDMCETNSLLSSHMRLGEMSTLGISASTSTIPAGCSVSTTSLHWLRMAEDRVMPHPSSTKAAPVALPRDAECVFERWVQKKVHRTAAMDDAMLKVAAAFDDLYA
ncbi:hypothetical protein, unknown function [Leishmania mexicana MHOM/GT/2001/U1103]|uniref:Uncharacterized protein n=1 Tax=Leishmania mexicana (strain MHOM/GT/2001/U1103) TaxID=929439 RepID=E9B241_LEIMU|nr:hypothetical protein, unknown function [Leishmania mexicana MHOM/GT/2001/U1103]CBZ29299.1 hypothetical protein, unknown function [Leishmania mexicana MHOM/GT/2001/U1103]